MLSSRRDKVAVGFALLWVSHRRICFSALGIRIGILLKVEV